MALWFETALLPSGWTRNVRLSISHRRIVKIETGVDAAADDERHAIAIPGLCNVHSHGFQRGMAGLAEVRGPEGDNFWTWREVMYRFLDKLTPEQIEAITAQAYVEMLEAGFTRVGEFHYLHHDAAGQPYSNLGETAERIAAAAERTGIALTLLPVFYAHSNFGGAAATSGQRRFLNTVDQFVALMEASRKAVLALVDANLGVAPHSLRAVTPCELKAITPMARGGPIHIHAAEQTREVDDCTAWSGQRPVEWLLTHADVDERWCLVHATHLTASETAALTKTRAIAGLCPVTEANLGDGIFPAAEYLQQQGRIGVGTDSNVYIDVAAELRSVEYGQRLKNRSRNVLALSEGESTGRRLFDAALAGGAQALGQPVGGIREGGPADLVSLDAHHPSLFGRAGDAILDSWIFAGARIDCVWRGGRKLVQQGKHLARDEIAIRYRRAIESVLE
ncbi:MAG: formimidoylglutamate deiminase [Alphaproteobacteria bacterium]|nr:formimidoylglutamate deiminase [Alphaproteobacteria bacterium]MBV9064066.1 formimidoylglutamate deiminase [Alphaproteobacteria bacterium]